MPPFGIGHNSCVEIVRDPHRDGLDGGRVPVSKRVVSLQKSSDECIFTMITLRHSQVARVIELGRKLRFGEVGHRHICSFNNRWPAVHLPHKRHSPKLWWYVGPYMSSVSRLTEHTQSDNSCRQVDSQAPLLMSRYSRWTRSRQGFSHQKAS